MRPLVPKRMGLAARLWPCVALLTATQPLQAQPGEEEAPAPLSQGAEAVPAPAPALPEAAPPAPPAAPAPASDPKRSSLKLDPLIYAGVALAAAGAPLAVVGVALAVGAAVLTGAWPRSEGDGTVAPLGPWDNQGLVSLRVYATVALIPLGLSLVGLGLLVLSTGVALAVYGFTRGE